ncbi:MAG TPA: hypothetical protein G4O08_13645 [Anaerolineae bacterium]|nr:hypothetical protein [Anaerolineae bacterium]
MDPQAKSIKNGATVMMIMSIFALVLSLMWIFITEIMFVSDFAAYTGQTFADYLVTDPAYAEIYIITKKLLGIVLLATSTLMTYITRKAYSKGERWSWFALLVAGGITWGSLIGYKIVIGYFKLGASSMTFIVGAILLAIGLALPAKAILGREGKTE